MISPILENFEIFETLHQIIIIGSNAENSIHKILKIFRWTSNEITRTPQDWFLSIVEDEYVYSSEDIGRVKHSLLSMTNAKLIMNNVYGIVGFVRFRQGYYMIVITKRSLVAKLGQHKIFKIDETKTVYLPGNLPSPWDSLAKTNESSKLPVTKHSDEKKYLVMFNGVDLSTDNYFSYSYDLSNTVQYNFSYSDKLSKDVPHSEISRKFVNDRFIWNWCLCPPKLRDQMTDIDVTIKTNWLTLLVHGYVGQSVVLTAAGCIEISVCLIARRSRHYAGTRFLKRGANLRGNVANEVETEQIVWEENCTTFEQCRVTSHVQLRGSIPLLWHQEMTKVVGKPPIRVTREDPYYETCSRHFSDLIYRYGTPIIVLNLVKQKEKNQFEGPLSRKLVQAINYLHSHFPDEEVRSQVIEYIEFDMARIQRNKSRTVLEKLAPIADKCLKTTRFFYSEQLYQTTNPTNNQPTIQCGVIRTNCIDCLDRTNTAQFVIGQAALSHQLLSLGVIDCLQASRNQNMDRMLQILYESHGNVLAMQYGGSELVHNIETYKKTAKFATHSRDFVQTVSRYLNNKFSDWDKQMSINLFLGIYKPWRCFSHDTIWSHKYSDTFLHDRYCTTDDWNKDSNNPHHYFKAVDYDQTYSCLWLPTTLLSWIPQPLNLYVKWCYLDCYQISFHQSNRQVKRIEHNVNTEVDYIQQSTHTNYERFVNNKSYCIYMVDFTDACIAVDMPYRSGTFSYSQLSNRHRESSGSSTSNFNEEADKSNCSELPIDPVKHLTDGPVMTALRNQVANSDKKSSTSPEEEDEDEDEDEDEEEEIENVEEDDNENLEELEDQQIGPMTSSRLFNESSGVTPLDSVVGKSHVLKFTITSYKDLSAANSHDCINSSANYFISNNLDDISEMKPLGDYSYSVNQYQTNSLSQQIYKDVVKFSNTGAPSISTSSVNFYQQYCQSTDYTNISSSYLLFN